MKGKDFLSILDLTPDEVIGTIKSAQYLKNSKAPTCLQNKTIALIFEKPSLRTRVSFEVAIRQMGGSCIFLSNKEIGLGIREPESDVAKVLDRLVDGIVARVFSHRSLDILAKNSSIPVINALSDQAHPCQALGDMLTIFEHLGRLDKVKVTFVGDGNNIAGSLALACSSVGADFTIASPEKYRLPDEIWNQAIRLSRSKGSRLEWVEQPERAVKGADVVYTDVWVSMGDEAEKEDRLKTFADYQVDENLIGLAKPNVLFMHDMPAHRGEEISENLLDHPASVVFQQAENRLHAQKAVLKNLFQD